MRIFLAENSDAENRKRIEDTVIPLLGNKLINPKSIHKLPLMGDEKKRLEHLLIDCCDEVWLLRGWESVPRAVEEKTYAEMTKKPVRIQGRNWKKFE